MKLYIDGHIHFYDNFSPKVFFDFAVNNFSKFGTDKADNKERKNILIFTEGKEVNFFNTFKNNKNIYSDMDYNFVSTDEDNSLLIEKNGKELMYLIQGRQIVTEDNIEILSIGTTEIIEDGKPSKSVIDKLIKDKKPAVIAWGVGKWLFKREKIVHKIITERQSPYLFIGDNSARPVFWGTPKLYKYAVKKGYKIINGSDPLPLQSEEQKAGSFGFSIEGDFDCKQPANSLIKLLMSKNVEIKYFGKRDGVKSFFLRQLKMFLKKHLG